MEIRATQAHRAYQTAKPAVVPNSGAGGSENRDQIDTGGFVAILKQGEATAKAAMVGKADPHALVMALTETELAVEAAATLRDKVIEAYQEILRMPV